MSNHNNALILLTFQIMRPAGRDKKAPEMFTFGEDHVLQIDRKQKSLNKQKGMLNKQKERLRKQQERLVKKEPLAKVMKAPKGQQKKQQPKNKPKKKLLPKSSQSS